MDRLKSILITVLEGYTGKGLNGYSYLTQNQGGNAFTVISVGQLPDKRVVDASLIVHIQNERIIIERDVNDKLLLDALLQAGLTREQIILAYTGEAIEELIL